MSLPTLDDIVQQYWYQLREGIYRNEDISPTVLRLLNLDCTLADRYVVLAFHQLLIDNSQSLDQLKGIAMAFNIFEKYCRHLLKPPAERSQMWRSVKFTTSIFQDKIDKVKGGRNIMRQMGYVQDIEDGLCFPLKTEPNAEYLLFLLADILYAKQELDLYLSNEHPHPERVEFYLTHTAIQQVCKQHEQIKAAESPPTTRQSLPQSFSNTTIAAYQPRISSSGIQSGSGYQVSSSQTQPIRSIHSENSGITDFRRQSIPTVVPVPINHSNEENTHDVMNEEHPPEREESIVCDICGESSADLVCTICDNKQLCPPCDERWHQHPKRKNHSRNKLSSNETVLSKEQAKSDENVSDEEVNPPPRTYLQKVNVPLQPKEFTSPPPPSPHQLKGFTGYVNVPESPTSPNEAGRETYHRNDNIQIAAPAVQRKDQISMMADMRQRHRSDSESSFPGLNSVRNLGYSTLQPERHGPSHQPSHYTGSLPRPAPGGPPTSKLLPSIMSTPDPNKRRAKLDIKIVCLHEEIVEIESKIHTIVAHNPVFYDDEEYGKLYKKKGMLQREVMELEKYGKELDEMIEQREESILHTTQPHVSGHPSIMTQPIYYPPALPSMNIGPHSGSPGSMASSASLPHQYQYPPVPKTQPIYYPPTSVPNLSPGYVYHVPGMGVGPEYHSPPTGQGGHPYGYSVGVPTGPGHPGYSPEIQSQTQRINLSSPINASVPCSSPGQYSLSPSQGQNQGYVHYNIPPETKQINSPPSDRSKIQNYRTESNQEHVREDPKPCDINQVVKSPDFSKMSAGKGTVYQNYPRPDLPPPVLERKPVNKPTKPQGKERKKSEGYQSPWICQHCTYHNNAGTNVCEICFKTSTNPTLLDAEGASTSTNVASSDSLMTGSSPRSSVAEKDKGQTSALAGAGAGASSLEENKVLQKAAEAGKFLKDDIDHILLEKKEAHRKFEEQQRKEEEEKSILEKRKAEEKQIQNQRNHSEDAEVNLLPVTQSEQQKDNQSEQQKNSQSESSNQNASPGEIRSSVQHQESSKIVAERRDSIGRLSQETKERSSSPGARRVQGESTSTMDSPKAAGKASGRTNLSFTETMDKINRERQHHQMMIESKEFIQYIKTAEKAGFDIEEATIAIEKENSNTISAITWLKEKWQQMVKTVITLAANEGSNMRQNEVGEVSALEAREALKTTKGSVPQAVKICVQNRQKMYKELVSGTQYPREEVLHAMHQSNGDTEEAMNLLNTSRLKNFIDRLWATEDDNPPGAVGGNEGATASELRNLANDVCNSVTNSLLGHADFQNTVSNKELNFERRARMIMVEGKLQSWGRAHTVIKILDINVAENRLEASLEDIVEAVRNCGDRQSSLAYLQQECQLCFSYYPMGKIRSLNCPCKMCVSCMKSYFEINIREKHVRNLCCPICQLPDMENVNMASDYFTFLTMLLTTMVTNEILDLYHSKLRDWHLQKDPNFRWCSHCGGGFIYADGEQNLAMTCPHCKKKTCFKCKKQWEDQHEGLTCEEYEQWKIDNDPENQAIGLAAHLEANGIDCPSCKMRYSLAKGGCMHFTCPQCGHQFCSGCGQMFDSQGMCTKYRSCRGKGLHCHHPRDCFYYLRDNEVTELQKLLKDKNVNFNTEIPPSQEPRNRCPVMEQKEVNDGKQDEACGKEIQQGHAGLCMSHYKEYLVGLINKNKLDPVHTMTLEELIRLIERDEKNPPHKKATDRDSHYRKKLVQFIKEKIPLRR